MVIYITIAALFALWVFMSIDKENERLNSQNGRNGLGETIETTGSDALASIFLGAIWPVSFFLYLHEVSLLRRRK